MSIIIDASRIKPSASLDVWSSCNQGYCDMRIGVFLIYEGYVTLDEGSEPSTVDVLSDEIVVHSEVPEEVVVACYYFNRTPQPLLNLGLPPLPARSQITLIRIIKPKLEIFLNMFNIMKRIRMLLFRIIWIHLHPFQPKYLRPHQLPQTKRMWDHH